uniref:Uncharacterized protein n=1 Tax=Rhizophora mucronata TaxID=61149 RepID=A0A2P2MGI9_RHIMU
MAYYYKTR